MITRAKCHHCQSTNLEPYDPGLPALAVCLDCGLKTFTDEILLDTWQPSDINSSNHDAGTNDTPDL
jgi:hypothetical protein